MLPVWLARVLVPLMILGLLLVGAWLAGQSLAPYLAFPPTPEAWDSKSFSWTLFIVTAFAVIGGVSPLITRVITAEASPAGTAPYLAAFCERRGRVEPWLVAVKLQDDAVTCQRLCNTACKLPNIEDSP